MLSFLKKILGLGSDAAAKIFRDGAEERRGQRAINEAEIAGAPQSGLRLWRSFLGWALAVAFIWEVIIRPIIETYWPGAVLPPSFMREISTLLLGMMGLGA